MRAYTGAGSNTVQTFPSDEESDDGNQVDFVSAWRPGQPPRSDCIIKLTKGKETKKVRIIAYYRAYPLLIFQRILCLYLLEILIPRLKANVILHFFVE